MLFYFPHFQIANILFFVAQRPTVPTAHTDTHTHTHTHTHNPSNEWWAIRRSCYLHNANQTQETSIHGLGGIRSGDHNNQAASYLRLRTHGCRYRQITPSNIL